ncbi:MAG: VWA domain-containing protein [Desulfomonile tiedjei]|uniref:VWA domain-containing protein n=1 Tax=Desulfomonile tiedjei TaxID=2358 RepID=A0A9D6V6J9_9BACT|nr:VWA domain-containing protein [Desulfomonile tiedjei]
MAAQNSGIFPENSLAGSIVLFGRVLKGNGFMVSIPAVMDALTGVSCVGLENRDDFKTVLKATFLTRQEESALFDRLFHEFWVNRPADTETDESGRGEKFQGISGPDGESPDEGVFLSEEGVSDSQEQEAWNAKPYVIYSPSEILRQQDFRDVPEGRDYWMAKLVREIAAPLLRRASKRRRPVNSAISLDFRRIFRRNVKYGGQIYELPGLSPKPKIKKLVFLCDVSGSMNAYQKFMLRFVKELQQLPTKVESFVFATDLHRITPLLARLPFRKAMAEIGRTVRDWSGGTRIGRSLKKFTDHWGDSLLGSSTVVLIHSDGWDRGEPALLEHEMAKIHRRAYRVFWINPLLGGPSYEPTCRGMRTALPHVDYFLPGHNLLSLERISGTLRGFL